MSESYESASRVATAPPQEPPGELTNMGFLPNGMSLVTDETSTDWKHYEIPVGHFYTGAFNRIFFANDHDVSNPTAESHWRNVEVDGVPVSLESPSNYLTGANTNRVVTASPSELRIAGNGWQRVLHHCTLNADSVLSFDYRCLSEGELHAIGFDVDDTLSPEYGFKLGGYEKWGVAEFPYRWDPQNLAHVTNPNPSDHPEFTAALSNPNLWWADSFRPYTNVQHRVDLYYGYRKTSKIRGVTSHPNIYYDAAYKAARVLFFAPDYGMTRGETPQTMFPNLGPQHANMASVQWEYKISPTGWRGGKQFQVAGAGGEKRHVVYKAYNGYFSSQPFGMPWGYMPFVQVTAAEWYPLNYRLTGPCTHSPPNGCQTQANLGPKTNLDQLFPEDHLSLGGQQYIISDEGTSGWITVTMTFDWRDPANHLFWMHLKDERTPRTLVVGIDGGGYPVRWGEVKSQINAFWVEFDNSNTQNGSDSHIWFRNLTVMKNQFAWEAAA